VIWLIFTIGLFVAPVLCLIFHPFSFVEEAYGFELIIEPWYMVLVNVVYAIFVLYALIGLVRVYLRSSIKVIRRKLEIIFLGLFIMLGTAIIFFTILPVFANIHWLKPVGYGIVAGCIIGMTFAFRPNRKNLLED
jgi:hypothetical protein